MSGRAPGSACATGSIGLEMARADGSMITGGTPEQFHELLKSELAKFGKLVKQAGVKIE